MDKRWIGILLILIIGLGCMYLIVITSTSVGNAVSVIDDVTVTQPSGFINSEEGAHFCVLHNKDTNETIRVKCLNEKTNHKNVYGTELKTLKGQNDITINKNTSNNTLSVIEYENQSSKDRKDIQLFYFDKCNHTFRLQLEHFTDDNHKRDYVNFIMNHMVYDFKQNSG